jgi:hypothetical protein
MSISTEFAGNAREKAFAMAAICDLPISDLNHEVCSALISQFALNRCELGHAAKHGGLLGLCDGQIDFGSPMGAVSYRRWKSDLNGLVGGPLLCRIPL